MVRCRPPAVTTTQDERGNFVWSSFGVTWSPAPNNFVGLFSEKFRLLSTAGSLHANIFGGFFSLNSEKFGLLVDSEKSKVVFVFGDALEDNEPTFVTGLVEFNAENTCQVFNKKINHEKIT